MAEGTANIVRSSSDLSDRLGIDKDLLASIADNITGNYRRFRIPKKAGGSREIAAPSPALLKIQRRILSRILYKVSPHKGAKAYIPRKCISDNARFHVGQPVLLKADVHDFFGSIRRVEVQRIFHEAGFGHDECGTLTELSCLNGSLPQGAATSGCLSNLVMRQFDKRLMVICRKESFRYTRYADDISISGQIDHPEKLFSILAFQLGKLSMTLNWSKAIIAKRNCHRQNVTGIVVNEKLSPGRTYLRDLRQEFHYIARHGLSNHAARSGYTSPAECFQILSGKVAFAKQVMGETDSILSWRATLADSKAAVRAVELKDA